MAERGERSETSESPERTEELAADLADALRPGDVVAVSGELGAGKTTFIRGACRALGVTEPVTSPTFTIGHLYEGRPRERGRGLSVAHVDLYRLDSLEDEEPGLLDDYLTASAIAFVEWPAIAREGLERVSWTVALEHVGRERRRITIARAGA